MSPFEMTEFRDYDCVSSAIHCRADGAWIAAPASPRSNPRRDEIMSTKTKEPPFEHNLKKRPTNRVMWGTKAIHKLGDISRERPDYCIVGLRPVDGNYIGNWVTGFGFVQVKFPIETTKALTRFELAKFKKLRFGIR